MYRKDFESFTNLKAQKQTAVELVGAEFVKELNSSGLYVKDEDFWKNVNERLNIPENYHALKIIAEQEFIERLVQEEREKRQAEIDRYNQEVEALTASGCSVERWSENGWTVEIFQIPRSEIVNGTFFATVTDGEGTRTDIDFQTTLDRAKISASSYITDFESALQNKVYQEGLDKLIKSIYLVAIYLTGCDEYSDYYKHDKEKRYSKESFMGVNNWNGFIHAYIDELEKDGYLKLSNTKRSLWLSKKAVKVARDILRSGKIDFSEQAEMFLKKKENHDEYIKHIDFDFYDCSHNENDN